MSDTLRLRTVDAHGEFEAEGDANDVISCWHDFRGVDLEARENGQVALDAIADVVRSFLAEEKARDAAPQEAAPEPAPEEEPEPEGEGELFVPAGRWTPAQISYLKRHYPDKSVTIQEMTAATGRSDQTIRVKAGKLGLSRPKGRAPRRLLEERAASGGPKRRFHDKPELHPEEVQGLPQDHSAVVHGRTLFPTTVIDALNSPRVLVSGENQRKLGSHVTKGPWAGMPIYHLTLEERATCPTTCHHWTTCYGNGMPQSRRHHAGGALLATLQCEIDALQERHLGGFVVRLHILGDFYSVEYVDTWAAWLDEYPALHVFGYTAWPRDSEIGRRVFDLTDKRWDRFAIRTSSRESLGGMDAVTTWSVPEGSHTEEGAIVCPAQTGKTACCGSCGLCWSDAARDKTIAFIAHGPKFLPAKEKPKKAAGAYSKSASRGLPVRQLPAEPQSEEPPEPAEKSPGSFGQNLQRRCAAPGCKNLFVTSKVRETVCPECSHAEVAA